MKGVFILRRLLSSSLPVCLSGVAVAAYKAFPRGLASNGPGCKLNTSRV